MSCPDRTADAFTGNALDEQLDETVRNFLTNSKKGLYDDRKNNKLVLSWIFKKDRHLFANREGGVLGFVRNYAPRETAQRLDDIQIDVSYFDHDWTLNDLSQANK